MGYGLQGGELIRKSSNRSVTLTDDGVTCSLRIEVNFEQESMVENLGKWKCRLIEKYAGGFHPKACSHFTSTTMPEGALAGPIFFG